MICLTHPQPNAIQRARDHGWSFYYSDLYQEWVMIAKDERWKRAILNRYKRGVGVYTLAELKVVGTMTEDERVATHLLMVGFNGEIE